MCGTKRTRRTHHGSRSLHHAFMGHHFPQVVHSAEQPIHNHTANAENKVCLTCGFINPRTNSTCDGCGSIIQVCSISKLGFSTGDEFVQCINCLQVFHGHHFDEWLKNSEKCPYCGVQLTKVLRGIIGTNQVQLP